MNAAPVHDPPPRRHARWRLGVLVAVLAGFFLMHGSSLGTVCADALVGMPTTAQSPPTITQPGGAATMIEGAASTVSVADGCACQDAMGAMCVPLRSPSMAALLAVLLAGIATPSSGAAALLAGVLARAAALARRRAGVGVVPVHVLVCVSRT